MRNIRPGKFDDLPGLTLTDMEVTMDTKRGNYEKNSLKPILNDTNRRGRVFVLCLMLLSGVVSCTENNAPQQEQKPVEAPATPVVKMSLPKHGEQVVKSDAPLESADKKDAATATPEARKSAQPAAPGAAVPAVKGAAKQKEEPKKPGTPQPGEKKALPAKEGVKDQKALAHAKIEAKKPAAVGVKPPAVAVKKDVSVAGAESKGTDAKKTLNKQMMPATSKIAATGEKKAHSAAGKVTARSWTLVVGTYLSEDFMGPDLVKVRKAGLDAAVQPGPRKKSTMNRLFLSEYDNRSAAQSELDKLKLQTADAFILDHGAKHAVYAGSYLLADRAASEKERLAAAGFSLTLKRADVAIPTKRLIAGSFSDRKAAEEALKKLLEAGLKATLVPQ